MTTTTSKRLTKADQARIDRDAARAELLTMLNPGDTVNVIQRRVSRSGMTRHLSLFIGDQNVTHVAAVAMGEKLDHSTGYAALRVGGCGMDMHFATVYNLGRALWPNGHPCTARSWRDEVHRDGVHVCPSNDHVNSGPGRDTYSVTVTHRDGGYALKSRTL